MNMTTDKIQSIVKKWQTTIEANVDVKTTDGYILRIFVIGTSKKKPNQVKRTTYAQSAHIHQIRKGMVDIIKTEVTSCDLKDLIQKLISEVIGKQIEKTCSRLHPLQNCMIRKVKMLKAPKSDQAKLMENYKNVPSFEEN
jgi:small subunit ribosomal protein S3Ae